MEASTGPPQAPLPNTHSLTEKIKQRLLKKGVLPTPKIVHNLRKKELQKSIRKSRRLASQSPTKSSHYNSLSEEFYCQTISKEFRDFTRALDSNPKKSSNLVGKPWESLESGKLRELASGYDGKEPNFGGKLKSEHLKELGLIFEGRKIQSLSSFLDDDIELEEGMLEGEFSNKRRVSEAEAIRVLVERLSASEITAKDWKLTKMMKNSGLQFMERQLLRILKELGDKGCWKQGMEVVEWVYGRKEHSHYKSRFVYTKLLAVLGKARRPHEALQIFRKMLGDCHIYPDMAAYHSIAVTLGQAGKVRELMNIIECMKEKPSKTIKNIHHRRNWDPSLQPDIVIFNSVLNACVASRQWKGVSWVFEQLRKCGLKANSATYGLAMEVMLCSEKYDMVHELFLKMKRHGESPKALTYKVLVKTFWKEGKVDEAIDIVRDMERRGIIGSASVYYELACCLCNNGRWQEALIEIEKLHNLRHSKPLAISFTGMILSALDGGHVDDCASIFEYMRNHYAPNIGTINAMLKVYGRNDMFFEAKELFDMVKRSVNGYRSYLGDEETTLIPDLYTYGSMLEASGRAHQWEYFEYVYKEMCIYGYHLDQEKHAGLLVEASRAGKWHLLEHVFDSILEAGQIPHLRLFSEMILRATSCGEYEKAVSLVGAMGHAPFRLNMKDWTSILYKNKDMIGDEHLNKLYNIIQCHEIPERSSASELVKALHAMYGCVPFTSMYRSLPSASCSHDDVDGQDSNIAQISEVNGAIKAGATGDMKLEVGTCDCDEIHKCRSDDEKRVVNDPHAFILDYDNDDDVAVLDNDLLSSVDDEASANLLYDALDEERESEVEESHDPGLPSANDILRFWEQKRKEKRQ